MPLTHGNKVHRKSCAKLLSTLVLTGLGMLVHGQFKPSDYTAQAAPLHQLNNGFHNINPFASAKGDKLWFTKIGQQTAQGRRDDQDIWVSQNVGGVWDTPTNALSGINSGMHDLIVGQGGNGQLLYVLQHEYGNDLHLQHIRAFREQGGKFLIDHDILIPSLGLQSEFFGFFVAPDESYIIISMKGEGSFGKEDLYVMLKKEEGWTKPMSLGARINSIGFEMSPYMADDGLHLYFASEGHGSYGSADIFVAVRLDDTWYNWSKPVNLGPNINTKEFEAYFSLNTPRGEAYFVSNREGKYGSLFGIKYKATPNGVSHAAASGFIRLEKLPSMNVKLNLLDENDRLIQSVTTNADGYFNLQSFLPDRDYKLVIDDSVRSGLGKADIFLTNDLGDKMVFMNERELGIFGFKVLSGQKVEEVERLEEMASKGRIVDKSTKITGKVAAFGTVKSKVTLNVVDENNNVVETIQTDEEGYFSFSTNAREKSYFLSVGQDLKGLVDVYEIFLTNDNPNGDIVVTKTDKHLFGFRVLADGTNAGLKRLAEHDIQMPKSVFDRYGYLPARTDSELAGYLKLGKLPMINTPILLMDENEHLLGKAVTDANGMFVFKDVLDEGNYTLKLDESQQDALEQGEIYLANNPDDVVFYLNDSRAGVFAFKKLSNKRPMTLYSLRTETESGRVVNEKQATLKGKFEYQKLPKTGVKLKLMDEHENVIQVTEVGADGEFQFEHYMVNKNYFISVEGGEGLSDIYEIYLSGQQRNVLVNRTDKFVFAFRVLPTLDIVLTNAYETDRGSFGFPDPKSKESLDFHEFDLINLERDGYAPLEWAVTATRGEVVKLRFSREERAENNVTRLQTITDSDVEVIRQKLIGYGVGADALTIVRHTRDQVIFVVER